MPLGGAAGATPYRARRSLAGIGEAGGLGERQRAVRAGAVSQVVTAGGHDLRQGGADDGQIGESGVNLGQLGDRALVQATAGVVAVAAGIQQLGDLGQGEPQPLGGLDDPQQGDRFWRIDPVAAAAAVGVRPPARGAGSSAGSGC
jgi:hypothetical protein